MGFADEGAQGRGLAQATHAEKRGVHRLSLGADLRLLRWESLAVAFEVADALLVELEHLDQ